MFFYIFAGQKRKTLVHPINTGGQPISAEQHSTMAQYSSNLGAVLK